MMTDVKIRNTAIRQINNTSIGNLRTLQIYAIARIVARSKWNVDAIVKIAEQFEEGIAQDLDRVRFLAIRAAKDLSVGKLSDDQLVEIVAIIARSED